MDFGTALVSSLLAGVALFFWGGLAQNVLPWGIKSVQQRPNSDGTGEQIAQSLNDGMMYIKDKVAAFVVAKPES